MPKPTFASLAPSPTNPTFLRVHSRASASPLLWTGDAATSGFSARNGNLAALTPSSYAASLAARDPPTPWAGWKDNTYTATSALDHLVRRSPPFLPDTHAADDGSPWISTTRSLTWAVWEVARRLSPPPAPVHAFVVAQPAAEARVELAVISPGEEACLDPLPLVRGLWRARGDGEGGKLTGNQRDALQAAEFAARACDETLFYGRIFASSVLANYEFTRGDIPIALPAYFFRHELRPAEDWVDALVWRPDVHSFPQALDLLQASRRVHNDQ
ncbi:hypothetical protein Q8F55_002615 [Vanrija albida]|uniref:Uncharacterized protein n=1 Tax=Vanrija albida TaxID=181172 RepID=A0ABR3QAH9_9TREE